MKGSAQRLRILTTSCPSFRGWHALRWWERRGGSNPPPRPSSRSRTRWPPEENNVLSFLRIQPHPAKLHLGSDCCTDRQTDSNKVLISFSFFHLEIVFFLSSLPLTFRYCILFLIFCAHADMQRDANKSVRLQSPCPLIQQSGRENALISTHPHPPQ